MSKCVFLLFFKVTFEWAGFHSGIPVAWEAPSPVGYGWVQGQLGGFKVSWPFEDSESAERSLGASCHSWSLTRGGAVSLPVRGLPAW